MNDAGLLIKSSKLLGRVHGDHLLFERVREECAQLRKDDPDGGLRIRHFGGFPFDDRISFPNPAKKRNPIIEWKTTEVPYSKASIRIILSQLCALFAHALEEKVITVNPAEKLGRFYKQAGVVHEIEPLDAEEVSVFLAAVLDRSWSKDYYPVFLC